MTQAGKVAEIFSVAGDAFTKLGNLAMSLQTTNERSADGSKWADEEIELLKLAIQRFGTDIEKISNLVKSKSTNQIKSALKQKAIQNLTSISANATQNASLKLVSPNNIMVVPSTKTKAPLSMNIPSEMNDQSIKFTTIPRVLGQKSKTNDVVTITGNSMFDLQQQHPLTQQPIAPKKVRIETNNQFLSATISPNQIIQSTPSAGIPVVASSQGFQMLLPQAHKSNVEANKSNVLSVLQSGVVQHVSDANTSVTVDVET